MNEGVEEARVEDGRKIQRRENVRGRRDKWWDGEVKGGK